MKVFDRLVQIDNLRRAWRWVQSNPSPAYKNYFRLLYSNYATAENELLPALRQRLVRGTYRPAHSCKIYLPKASGGLRTYTLLTVEDQIIYQAYANIVAERFLPEIRSRYFSEVFSHMYAGPMSCFFYRKWTDGFAAFNKAQRRVFADGLCFTAQFDLTACYDSLDHNVIRHFLNEIGCDQEFIRSFIAHLSYWTSTGRGVRRIYQGHGIPQGPLSSGLIAEVVLHHFDRHRRLPKGVRYLRYVDDIRLYAKTEPEVRAAVYDLDLMSKEIGLFPQTAKIAIHKVDSIEDELVSVSRPDDELDWERAAEDQDRVHRLLADLSPRCRVSDTTRFKFLLARAEPRAVTNRRLWRILTAHPELHGNILAYFRRYSLMPRRDAARLVQELDQEQIHAVKIADLIQTAGDARLPADHRPAVDEIVKKHWRHRDKLPADLVAALGRWSIKRDLLTSAYCEIAAIGLAEWYPRAQLTGSLDSRAIPQPGLTRVFFKLLDDQTSDVAIAAAVQLGLQMTTVDAQAPMHHAAGPVLRAFGVLDGQEVKPCGVKLAFEKLLGKKPPAVDWKQLFGKEYRHAETKAVRWSSYLADPTALVNAMDVFCDMLLTAIYAQTPSLGTYSGVGSVLSAGGRLDQKHPCVFKLVESVHQKRRESDLSHPVQRRGKAVIGRTSFIQFSYLRTARKLGVAALSELAVSYPVRV